MSENVILPYLGIRDRIGRLDRFLLYVSGITTFVYSVLRVFFCGPEALLMLIPLFIIGFVLPVYVGYFRGIVKDMLIERFREWSIFYLARLFMQCIYFWGFFFPNHSNLNY